MAQVESAVVPPSSFHSDLDFVVHDWIKKFECKTLNSADLKTFWARNVPAVYSPKPECDCLNLVYDEEAASRVLYDSLERLIADSNEPKKIFEELQNLDTPPTLCGRVFKMGEPTYSCRDCALDPTCVLCVDCFRNSAHRHHRYKMNMSGGGGYCDCGDEEAWKSHPYCETHLQGKNQSSENSSPLDKLPPDIVERMRLVMQVVLRYCYEILTWEHAINLPADLESPNQLDTADTYATVLFNDEVHTYEDVIQTLGRAIGCSQKEAVDFATTIDREGRSIVKCSNFNACNQVRHMIERITSRHGKRPLKVVVMHTVVIAHQIFAMRLLTWLQKILAYTEGFRLIFSEVMMTPVSDCPLLESVLSCDTQLWKSARNQWHQLFISGMLMDQQCKKTFAKVFTKNYPVLMKDFIADDHEHSISIASLSVQIFTVPTLAHSLIQKEDAISVLLRTFLTECERNRNEDGKLAFERNQLSHTTFRRAQYVLYDLKYLLALKPQEWNDVMRKNFIHGMQSLLTLLSWMQGMDSVVRQVGQHVEFEAEWETGINLQLKLASVITLALEWCGSDRVVLVKSIRAALKHLEQLHGKMICVGRELADHSASCIDYDVSSMPVTVHLPLTRFVAGLLLHLEKYDLTYDSPEFFIKNKPSPEQLMELPLRTLVMVAQFRGGMWRRNGYSLLNQVYFYHNVRLRDEMLDRDIMMMQIAASMIESNEFLIHLLNKYGLLIWAWDSYDGVYRKAEDDYTRQTLTVAEEFLGLILTIVSERHIPGIGKVTDSDRIKKEIIQLLCIEPMPHSQLFKMLPKDPNYETGMEEVISEVASFKKPLGSGTGKYELNQEYYKDFNPFFYHYTREEQSKAEEVQLKRKKQFDELCCPPPVPPPFCTSFCMVINILQCDVMLHIMKLVIQRTLNLQSTAFTETQFEKVLHLIGIALHEEQYLLKGDKENSFFNFTEKFMKKDIFSLLEECLNSPRIETQRDLLKWVLKKIKTVVLLRKTGDRGDTVMDVSSSVDSQFAESSKKDKNKNAEQAAARRARIMARMTAMQQSFIREYADLFKEVELEETSNLSGSQQDVTSEIDDQDSVALGSKQRGRMISSKVHTCILCREDQEVTASGRALVLAAYVQRSTVLSKNRKHLLTNPEKYDALLLPSDLFSGPHASTCGHVMHSDCWQKFFDSVLMKEQRRPLRISRHISFDVEKNEFLCPLCERLSNSVIPLVPPISTLVPESCFEPIELEVDDWLMGIRKAVEKVQVQKQKDPTSDSETEEKFQYQYKPAPLCEVAACLPRELSAQFCALFSKYSKSGAVNESCENLFSESLDGMIKLFSQTTYTIGLGINPNDDDPRVPVMSWWSCAYIIHAIEWLIREQKKPLFGKLSSRNSHCLEAIIHLAGTSMHVFNHEVVRTHCVRMLRFLLLGEHHLSSPQCCLELDAFALLVFLTLSVPVLFEIEDGMSSVPFPLGNSLNCHILHLIFMLHLVQLLLTYFSDDFVSMETETADGTEDSEVVVATHFYREVMFAAGMNQDKPMPSGQTLVHCIKEGMLPFLRSCAIFFHFLTDVSAPQKLQEVNENEFENLCLYLGLPCHISEILHSSSLKQLALSWVRHPRILHLLNLPSALPNAVGDPNIQEGEVVDSLVKYPLSANQLISLPTDYSELINSVSLFTCPNSDGDDSRSPTMCLVCGAMLCSQSYCCQTELSGIMVGACTHHAHFCGAGVGIFLRIRDCKILLLSGKTKGCYLPPPYVDDYGETDQGLYRGNPLHLCIERYQELHHLWLSHGIPEQIAHVLEESSSIAVNNWQLM